METTKDLPLRYDPLATEVPATPTDVILYRDPVCPYLRLRVTQKSKNWHFFGSARGTHFKRQLGDARIIGAVEARLRAFEIAKQLEKGDEPATAHERKRQHEFLKATVGGVFAEYFDQHASNCRTADEIMRGRLAYWNDIELIQVSKLESTDVQAWVNKLAKTRGKATATKQFTHLRACLKYAIQHKLAQVPADCLVGVKAFKSEAALNYLKPGEELQRLAAALDQENQDIRDAIWLLLWTGQRKSNVLAMEWSEVDFDRATWSIPPAKTKTKKQYSIALTPRALELLRARKEHTEGKYVFPCVRNSNTRHLRYINKAWLRIRERAQLGKLRPHDLRHTAATWLAMSGASAHVIQQALQHSSIAISQRYVHMEPSAVRDHMAKAQEMFSGGMSQ